MVAKMWAFDPAEVRLPPGADVDLYLSAARRHARTVHRAHRREPDGGAGRREAARTCASSGRRRVPRAVPRVLRHRPPEHGGQVRHRRGAPPRRRRPPPRPAAASARTLGKQLFQAKGCVACHTVDGTPGIGPTLKGRLRPRARSERRVHDASSTRRHRDEICRARTSPASKGFQPVMPELPLTDAEVKALVDYMKTL